MAWGVVKCRDPGRNSNGEGSTLGLTDAQKRSRGEQLGLETPLVHGDNDAL